MPSLQEMFSKYNALTSKQRGVLDYLRNNLESICYITLRDLSEQAGVSEVSILRLCRILGFEGFQALKDQFRQELVVEKKAHGTASLAFTEGFQNLSPDRAKLLSGMLAREAQHMGDLLSNMDGDQLYRCVTHMIGASKIYIFGHDGCRILGDYLAHRLNYFRLNAVSIQMGLSESVRVQLSKLRPEDFVVLFSFPPYYHPAQGIARFAAHRNIPVLTIAESMDSPAIVEGGYTFLCGTDSFLGINSFTTPASFIHILTLCIANELGPEALKAIEEDEKKVSAFLYQEVDYMLK